MAGARKFGREGDFVTAPELSPLFAAPGPRRAPRWRRRRDGGEVLEFGAGTGALPQRRWQSGGAGAGCPAPYLILEFRPTCANASRGAARRAAERRMCARVDWLDRPPDSLVGVVVANEVLDAMPVERFVVRDGRVMALGVEWRFGPLRMASNRPRPRALRDRVERIRDGGRWRLARRILPRN